MIDIARNHVSRATSSSTQVLADGAFPGRQARDLVLALLDASADAHKLRNWTAQVHTESPDLEALEWIAQLEAAREELGDRIAAARADGSQVRLRATLQLEIEPAPARR